MRKLLMIAPVAALAALGASMSAAQDSEQASAASTSRSYDLGAFEEIAVVGPHHVVVSVGPAFSVRAEGPQQTLADTEVEVEDGQLEDPPARRRPLGAPLRRPRRRRDNRRWRCWDDYQPATFHVTLPRISGASLVGGGDMRIDRVEGEDSPPRSPGRATSTSRRCGSTTPGSRSPDRATSSRAAAHGARACRSPARATSRRAR